MSDFMTETYQMDVDMVGDEAPNKFFGDNDGDIALYSDADYYKVVIAGTDDDNCSIANWYDVCVSNGRIAIKDNAQTHWADMTKSVGQMVEMFLFDYETFASLN